MAVRKLTCPSCGATVDIPAGLDRAHCIYCGSEIIIEETEASKRASDLANYLDLGETALEGGNVEEAEQWFNKALELDGKNEQAWIGKAVAVQGSSSTQRSRFEESLKCIQKALEINPDSEAVKRAKRDIISRERHWMDYLATQELELAVKIRNTWIEASAESLDFLGAFGLDGKANQLAAPHIASAVNYLKQAHALEPDNRLALMHIIECLTKVPGARQFGDPAPYKQRLRLLELREKAQTELPVLRRKLWAAREALAQAEQRGGFFSGRRIKKLRDEEQSLVKSIEEYEEALNGAHKEKGG